MVCQNALLAIQSLLSELAIFYSEDIVYIHNKKLPCQEIVRDGLSQVMNIK